MSGPPLTGGASWQVRKWQNADSLSWNEQGILAVARYLNESFYRFELEALLPACRFHRCRPSVTFAPSFLN